MNESLDAAQERAKGGEKAALTEAVPEVSRRWRTVSAEGAVTGTWTERPPVHDEAWVRTCIAEHHPDDRIEVQVTTVSPWTPSAGPRGPVVTRPDVCGAIPDWVDNPVPCAIRGPHEEHLSTTGCAGSEVRWPNLPTRPDGMTPAEERDLRAAFDRDRWADEWNSLPTAINRLLGQRAIPTRPDGMEDVIASWCAEHLIHAFRHMDDDAIAAHLADALRAAGFGLVSEANQRIAVALEITYWDRPYDTRIEAIRDVLHGADEVAR